MMFPFKHYLGTSQSGGLANSQAEPAAGEREAVPVIKP
jgi:hypothetical protein